MRLIPLLCSLPMSTALPAQAETVIDNANGCTLTRK